MQLETSKTISPKVNTNLLQSDFSNITQILERKSLSASRHPFVNFRGHISIGDLIFPIQKFSIREKENLIFVENFPENSSPKIEMVLEKRHILKVNQFNVSLSENTVQGEILYTRFILAIANSKNCFLHFSDIDFTPFKFSFIEAKFEIKPMLYRANLFRKLGFIENVFERTKFYVADTITSHEVQQTEILFRGLTEGEFVNPSDSFVTIYNYRVKKEDLENNFLFAKREFSVEFSENFFLLGRFFDVGKIIVKVEKASVVNSRKISNVKENEIISELKLNVFDSQIHYIFEKYTDSERLSKNRLKLQRFRNTLEDKEPKFLSSLLDDPLSEINDKSATETLEALLQYYDFPDRFSVLKPELQNNRWKVPIALTYPKHEPLLLTNAFVDVKTGKVEMKISFDELLKKGKKKAKEAFSIA